MSYFYAWWPLKFEKKNFNLYNLKNVIGSHILFYSWYKRLGLKIFQILLQTKLKAES